MVFQGFLGHFGEMHLSEHTPIRPWAEAGFTLKRYTAALKHLTGAFKAAFPDKPIFQELGNPSYNTPCPGCGAEPISLVQAKELVPYLVSEGINLKYNGLGANWDRWGSDPFIEGWYVDYCRAYHDRIRLIVENIATFHAPAELETLRRCHASYTNRGGELPGLPECGSANSTTTASAAWKTTIRSASATTSTERAADRSSGSACSTTQPASPATACCPPSSIIRPRSGRRNRRADQLLGEPRRRQTARRLRHPLRPRSPRTAKPSGRA